jgi:hypothetical protein
MAIITRVRGRQTTPDASLDRYEAHTIKKTQFFNAYDEHYNSKPLTVIAEDAGTTRTTATRWLEERREHGRVAYRSNRKKSKKLGRKPKLLKERVRELCDKEKNPVRDQQYEATPYASTSAQSSAPLKSIQIRVRDISRHILRRKL